MKHDVFDSHMKAVARSLLGDPNPCLSTLSEMRYGTHGSLVVDCERGVWFDHEAQKGGGVLDLIRDRTGLPNGAAVDWLRERGFLPCGPTASLDKAKSASKKITATYDYFDEHGKLLFQVVRYEPKSFLQRRPDPNRPNNWIWNRGSVPSVPYRLPELIRAAKEVIYITEGEKDADALAKKGLIATTNAGGAGSWPPELNRWFEGRVINILVDNDEAGIKHGRTVAEALKRIAREVRVVQLPGLGPKEDVSDWLNMGGHASTLSALCASASRCSHEPVSYTAAQLKSMSFPSLKYVVPGYIVEGLTLFAGKPKRGKSWACLDMAIAVASGGIALGGIKCEVGDVLYAALEDNPRRLQRRMTVLTEASEAWPSRLTFTSSMPRLKEGGIDMIRDWIERAEHPRLVVIDTLAKVRDAKGGQQSSYEADYAAVSELKDLADKKGIAIVLVHHVRKMDAEDPIDTVSGTTGLTGAVDTILVIVSNTWGTTLYGRGRDIEDVEKAIRFDRESCRWNIEGDASEVRRADERSMILGVLLRVARIMSPAEISAATGMKDGNVRRLVLKMVVAGEIVKTGRGCYRHPDCSDVDDIDSAGNNGNKVTSLSEYRRIRDGDDNEN